MNLMQILTNENQILINIITIVFTIPEAFLFYKISSSVVPIENFSIKRILVFIASMTVSGLISVALPNSLIKDILVLIIFALSLRFIFHMNLRNTFISLVNTHICALVSEYMATSLLIYSFKINYEVLSNTPLYYILVLFLTIIFMTLTVIFIRLLKKKKLYIKNIIKLSTSTSIIINLVFGIATMAIETYLFSVYIDVISINLLLIMIITTLIYFLLSMYSLIRTNILEKTEEDLENAKLYNQTLTLLHDNIRGFKHDFNNIVQSIGGYIALNDIIGLKDYYRKLLEECKLTNTLNLLNPETINNPSIYSLLTNKYYLATKKEIIMNFSIFSDLSNLKSNMYEISRILGILLDNAIEAAEVTDKKLVNIEIKSDDKKHIFIIKNSCKDTNISTTKIFEKGYSTKNRNSGFGLWNVHKILSKNTNLDLYTTIENDMFCQQFTIYY